jgi:hypothetical protein
MPLASLAQARQFIVFGGYVVDTRNSQRFKIRRIIPLKP